MAMLGRDVVIEDELKKALSDEWAAHYAYWLGSVVIDPARYEDVLTEFVEHSSQEYDHAVEIAVWLWKYNGQEQVSSSLNQLLRTRNCEYIDTRDTTPAGLIRHNINAEKCAIEFYTDLLKVLAGRSGYYGESDLKKLLEWILEEEKKHLSDLEKLRRQF